VHAVHAAGSILIVKQPAIPRANRDREALGGLIAAREGAGQR